MEIEHTFIIENNTSVREVIITRISGNLVLVRFLTVKVFKSTENAYMDLRTVL